jgi:hypothetical protein
MALAEEIARGWGAHAEDPEGVARQASAWVALAEPADVPALAGLLLHVLGEHLGDWERGTVVMEALAARHALGSPGGDAAHRGLAVFRLCAGDSAGAEALLAKLATGTAPRNTHEARVLALAAATVGARSGAEEAARWLVRAANLTYELSDRDDAIRTVAVAGNNLACALEDRISAQGAGAAHPEEVKLLRLAASVARTAWERAGTWREVERAEYRLAMSSLVVGEPFGAVGHAEACRAICEAHEAPVIELLFAHEALARARHAIGDLPGALASREVMRALQHKAEPQDAALVAKTMRGLEALLAQPGTTAAGG